MAYVLRPCATINEHQTKVSMKKINSIDYGSKVIGTGLVFLALIPAVFYALNNILGSTLVQTLMYISLGIGAVIEVGFGCVLLIELRQDRIIGRHYENNPESAKTPQQILDERRWKRKGQNAPPRGRNA